MTGRIIIVEKLEFEKITPNKVSFQEVAEEGASRVFPTIYVTKTALQKAGMTEPNFIKVTLESVDLDEGPSPDIYYGDKRIIIATLEFKKSTKTKEVYREIGSDQEGYSGVLPFVYISKASLASAGLENAPLIKFTVEQVED